MVRQPEEEPGSCGEPDVDAETQERLKKLLSERLEGNSQMLQGLCKLRNLTFSGEDLSQSLNAVFLDMLGVIRSKAALKESLVSPY